jgi:hypothetical protein
MAIFASKLDVYDLKVVHVLEIFAERGFCVTGAAFAEDHVTSCAFGNSVDVMAGEVLVALRPTYVDLLCLAHDIMKGGNWLEEILTLLFLRYRPLLRTCTK